MKDVSQDFDDKIPQEIEEYIRESIDYTLGLPVSTCTLELKLQASEEARRCLRDQYFLLQSRLKEKDDIIERARAESSMNAQALKKFVEENQKLAMECSNLIGQCKKWERECSLYDHDREALMEFGNEADERAKEAEIRAHELEEEFRKLSEELQFYKHQCDMQQVDSLQEGTIMEQFLLESLVTSLIGKEEVKSTAQAFLEANNGLEVCERMLKMWSSLKPSTQKVLALVSELNTLQKDKEHLRINLRTAEEEVKVLFEENNILDEENKRLMRQLHRERRTSVSGGKHSGSASAKETNGNKRKCSPKMSSPIEKKLDFGDADSPRPPLSPLQHNSVECRMHKK